MSLVDKLRSVWYGKHNESDVYDSDDFEKLWEIEEQGIVSTSPNNKQQEKANKREIIFDQIRTTRENTNVIQHPSITPQSEVVVIEPRSFDEALDIVEELRCRRSVILNLQYLDSEQSQRVVDFLSGATHALEGHQQRVGQGVFIFAPNNFTINAESKEARALRDAFWGRRSETVEKEPQLQYAEPVKKSSIF